MSIDWSKQPFREHTRLINGIVKQIEKENPNKSRKWKHDQLIERYRAETKIEDWGEQMCFTASNTTNPIHIK